MTIQWEESRTDLTSTYQCGGGIFTNGTIAPIEIQNGYVIEPDQVCRLHPDGGRSCFKVYRDGEYFYSAREGGVEAGLMRVVRRDRCT